MTIITADRLHVTNANKIPNGYVAFSKIMSFL